MLNRPTRVSMALVLHIRSSIDQTTKKRSGSRITRRNDHRKAVSVPRSISANLVLSSIAAEPIIHTGNQTPTPHNDFITHCRIYPRLRVASWKLYKVAWGITLVMPEESDRRRVRNMG